MKKKSPARVPQEGKGTPVSARVPNEDKAANSSPALKNSPFTVEKMKRKKIPNRFG